MRGRITGFEPVQDTDFVAGQVTPEPMTEAPRDTARSNWSVFRARNGTEVAVPETTIERMVAFGKRTEPNEWYALLVGRLFTDAGGTHVVVDGAVFDAEAEATQGSIRTTPTSEFRTRQLAAFQHPGSIPIGWAHGHVRCQARYSSVDRENQKRWTQPHSVGIVIDPWDPKLLAVYLGPESELLQPVSSKPPTTACAEPMSVAPAAIPLESTETRRGTDPTALAGWFAAWSVPFIALAVICFSYVNSLTERVDRLVREVRTIERSAEHAPTSPSQPTDQQGPPQEPPQCAVANASQAEESGWFVPLALPPAPSSTSTPASDEAKRSVATVHGSNGVAKSKPQAGTTSPPKSRKTDLASAAKDKRPAGKKKQTSRTRSPAAPPAMSNPSQSEDAPSGMDTQQQQRDLP